MLQRVLSDHPRSLALDLLREYDTNISRKFLLKKAVYLDLERFASFSPFSGLHCASLFGISEVVLSLILMNCHDINSGDFGGHTPLAWATRNGHDEVVEMLLELGDVDPNKENDYGQTPLSHAAQNGH